MLYDKLNSEMRRTVDEYAVRLSPLAWNRRKDLLVDAARPFVEDLAPEHASLAAKGFMTAVLERWDDPIVADPRQAHLYMLSLNPRHRAMAAAYHDAHPHRRAMIEGGVHEESLPVA